MEYSLEERRRQLYHQIREWNVNRLDLFSISEPNQNLEFYGVMRFYYQDDNRRVSTKCIRVASSATTVDVILSLIEKFRPDLRMLSHSQYGLYEVHASGEERRLGARECPLLVQLHWGRDDLEGRFLLKRETARTAPIHDFGSESSLRQPLTSGVNRRSSTKEKKLHQYQNQGSGKENDAERLYQELPDSNFTRSISNPEIVMQKRRQAKLQKKLEEICSSEWGPDSGGTLKIYGQTICGELPYKTLLLSLTDNAFNIVKETLEKYKLEKENPNDYCLVKVISPNERFFDLQHEETVLTDYDCPLDILQNNPQLAAAGCITFHLRRKSDMASWKSGFPISDRHAQRATPSLESLPFLVEVNPDGTRPHDAHLFTIPLNGLEIGRERSSAGEGILHLQLTGNDILPRHCIITCHGNVVAIVPYGPDALVVVNNCRVYDRAVLEHGMMILLGRTHFFQFHDPILEQRSLPVNRALSLPAQNESQDLLPAILEYREEEEDRFLSAIIPEVSIYDLQFKLMPAYLTYMTARFAYRAQFLSSPSVRNRSGNMTLLCSKVAFRIYRLIQMSQNNAGTLAFWMANSSELLNFLFRDRQLNIQTLEVREQLADCVQMAFTYLVRCVCGKLNQAMPMFFETGLNASEASDAVTNILSSVMSLLLTTSVNAALTIQLFSQMFHFINMWLFNRLVKERQLCTREWGQRLRSWLCHIEVWSENQGLELAAECHLARIIQTAILLELPKRTADDITVISSSCFKLNSLQLRRLLENFIPAPDEPKISLEFIDGVVGIAQNTADETARREEQEIHLLEDPELRLPFLMPDDGYSCEFIKGILEDIVEYIKPLAALGICRLIVNRSPQNRLGLWTVHFLPSESFDEPGNFPVAEDNRRSIQPVGQVPEVAMVSFRKMNDSLGLSIVAAIGEGQNVRRIFIKSVVPGGAAATDGRLQAGDELLEVDGRSLTGMTQEVAAEAMSRTGQIVTLKVAKQSALYYGLATKLSQQSPGTTSSPSFSRGSDTRDGTLRGQQGPLFHQTQPPSLGAQPIVSGPARSSATNYPSQHLHHSQPTFGHRNLENPSSGNDDEHVSNAHAAPTGGRYSRTINRSSFGQSGPVRSKSVPDFDRADSGAGPRVVSSGRTLPRELHPGGSVYQPERSGGDSLKRPILYPSTREVYSKGNYPPMGPHLVENGPKASAAARVSFGRSGRPTNPVVGIPQETQPFSPSRQTNIFNPSEVAPRPQHVNGQPQFYDSETLDRDPQSSFAKGSGLTRYPNTSGLDRIGLSNQQEQNIRPRHQTTNFRRFPDYRQPDVVNSSSNSVSHNSHPAHKGQPWYPSQRMEWVEEYAPPVPPLPANIYASVSRGTTNQNMMRVGPGPANPVKGFQESAWTTTKCRNDFKPQHPSMPKEPEYARVQQRTGPPPPLVTRSVVVSPWVREEKETETKKLEVEKRQIREKEILELELRRRLTSGEEERLKRLKLEAEFDRRLEEVSNRETPDDDTEMTPAGRAKLIKHYQQEYEFKRQQREEEHLRQEKERLKEQERRRQGQQQQNFEQRLEEKNWEMQRQEQYLKQMEDYHRKQQGVNQMHYPPKGSAAPQRPAEPVEDTYSIPRRPHQVFKTPPQPPERNSSFEVYRTGNALIPTDTGSGSLTVAVQQPPVAKKSVSFQTDDSKGVTNNQFRSSPGDLQQTLPSTFPAKVPQDLSRHVSGANISKNPVELGTPFSPGTDDVFTFDRGIAGFNYQRQDSTPLTPGVVGAQESYLDPRERLAAAKLASALTTGSYMTPERMSFRDKMKRFASETGEEAPKDRPKISRAQQRLEADLSIQ